MLGGGTGQDGSVSKGTRESYDRTLSSLGRTAVICRNPDANLSSSERLYGRKLVPVCQRICLLNSKQDPYLVLDPVIAQRAAVEDGAADAWQPVDVHAI